MGNYKKHKFLKWFFLLIPILIVLGVYTIHFSYLYIPETEKSVGSFLDNAKITLIDLKDILYNEVTTTPVDINKIDIPIFKLFVKQDNIDKLNSQLPSLDYIGITHVSKDYVGGYIAYGNNEEVYPTRVRYRGDNFFHWRFPKKSWRIKLENKEVINGSNKINLINPKYDDHINTQLSYDMSEKLSLLTPRSYFTAVFLNNIYNGVYYYTDQIDETFLRMKNKLPGDLFVGEINESFNFLFNNSNYWELVATQDGDEKRAKKEFDFFIKNVNEKHLDKEGLIKFYNFFNRYIDENYIQFDALTSIIASPQPDQFHNHKFYLDPSNGRYETIPWDLLAFLDEYLNLSLNYFNNPLILKMHLIPEFVNKRNQIIYDSISRELSEEKLIEIVDEYEKKIEYEMEHDKLKDAKDKPYTLTTNRWRKAVERLRNNIKERYAFLKNYLDNVGVTVYIVHEEVIFDVNGESAVKLESNNLIRKISLKEIKENELLYPGRSISKEIDWMDIFSNSLDYASLRYEYVLKDKNLDGADIKLINSVTGKIIIPKIIKLENINQLPKLDKVDSIHPWILEEREEGNIITINRNVILSKDLFIDKKDTLVINPGVKIKLDKGVSIISYGQIIAKGTKENPIIITKNANEPWGSIIIQGLDKKNAKSNYFEYVHINGGSGTIYEHVHYTGQVSVHNSIAYFENCKFSENNIEDDNFHAIYSYIELINCEIFYYPADGIDFDISEGKIIDSKIIGSPTNDCVDLMTSNVLIEGNYIDKCKDKGISVGEKSSTLIINNHILNSDIGIAIKDESEAIIANNVIENNNVAIAAYHKSWHYEKGGNGKIYKNVLKENKKDYSIDEFSSELDVATEDVNKYLGKSFGWSSIVNSSNTKLKFIDSNLTILDQDYFGHTKGGLLDVTYTPDTLDRVESDYSNLTILDETYKG